MPSVPSTEDSKAEDLSKNTKEPGIKPRAITVILWVCLIITVIALISVIAFSFQQLASGNPAFGVSTAAFASLFGAVIITILNGAYFEPKRAAEEREHQLEMAREERERKGREEHNKFEAQKAQLRKALYNEMVTVYCTISTYVDWVNALEPRLYDTPLPTHIVRDLVNFSLYESMRENTLLLFWQLAEAQTIAAIYRITQDALEEAAPPESSSMTSYKKAAEVLEGALLRCAVKIAGDANFNVTLLLECGDVTWKPCIGKLEAQLKDPEKLGEASLIFDMTRLNAMLKRS